VTVDPRFELTDEHVAAYRRDGFVKLERFLHPDLLEHVRGRISGEMRVLGEGQRGFHALGYDIFGSDPEIGRLLRDEAFTRTLTTLADRSLLYTQGIGFEIQRGKHHGFPWHVGTQSFGYVRGTDYGCSLWIPLAPIDPEGQGGGMSAVPARALSGQFLFTQVDPLVDRTLDAIAAADAGGERSLSFESFVQLRHGILNDPSMATLLDCSKRTDRFEPGDVLFFDKYVIHASEPLGDGPLASRAAFVMRFVDLDARFDARRASGLEFQRRYFGVAPQSDFHLRIGEVDGAPIRDSRHLEGELPRVLHHVPR
jgi:hypothetical protein